MYQLSDNIGLWNERPMKTGSLNPRRDLHTRAVDLRNQTLYGQTHDIEITALDPWDAYHTDPLLYAISTRLIERLIMIDIELDLFILQRAKVHPSGL